MTLFTIGFTKKSAATFFTRLRDAGVNRLLDVRLNNTSQLAGFAKRDDLRFFAREICGIEYLELPALAPTPEILTPYKRDKTVPWHVYERQYLDLIAARRIEETLPRDLFDSACLLCSEDKPHHCHRRLAAEYLQRHWNTVAVLHI